LKVVFAGTPKNAAETLEALVDAGVEVVGVLTREDAVVGRKKVLTPSAVALVCEQRELPVFKSNSVSESALEWLASLKPTLGVIVAYGAILRRAALDVPEKGWINLHYSMLPNYPGASPVQQAILDGLENTGVTVFALDEGVDSGPIIAQQQVQIHSQDTAGELLERLTPIGSSLLLRVLNDFDRLASSAKVQNSSSPSVQASKIDRAQARVHFSNPARDVHNLVRAMNPEPMAWFELDGEPVRVLETRLVDRSDLNQGELSLIGHQVLVGCIDSALELMQVQPAGKNPMNAADWFRGLRGQQQVLP
jgi:methionyl-tRNA formyltransferase